MGVFHLSWGQGVRTASPPAPPVLSTHLKRTHLT